HGSLRRVGNALIYTTRYLQAGTDSFTYKIADGHGGNATGTVNINVLDLVPPKILAVRLYYGAKDYVSAPALARGVLPWAKVDRIAIQFNEDVTANPSALTLL